MFTQATGVQIILKFDNDFQFEDATWNPPLNRSPMQISNLELMKKANLWEETPMKELILKTDLYCGITMHWIQNDTNIELFCRGRMNKHTGSLYSRELNGNRAICGLCFTSRVKGLAVPNWTDLCSIFVLYKRESWQPFQCCFGTVNSRFNELEQKMFFFKRNHASVLGYTENKSANAESI